MPDIRQLRLDYLSDICTALSEFVAQGGNLHLESDTRPGDILQITFTLEDAERFHAHLRETMMRRLR